MRVHHKYLHEGGHDARCLTCGLDRDVHVSAGPSFPIPPAWADRAACKGRSDLMFPGPGERPERMIVRERLASQLCAECDVIDECDLYVRELDANAMRAAGWHSDFSGLRYPPEGWWAGRAFYPHKRAQQRAWRERQKAS